MGGFWNNLPFYRATGERFVRRPGGEGKPFLLPSDIRPDSSCPKPPVTGPDPAPRGSVGGKGVAPNAATSARSDMIHPAFAPGWLTVRPRRSQRVRGLAWGRRSPVPILNLPGSCMCGGHLRAGAGACYPVSDPLAGTGPNRSLRRNFSAFRPRQQESSRRRQEREWLWECFSSTS